jgi:hypothetical protein
MMKRSSFFIIGVFLLIPGIIQAQDNAVDDGSDLGYDWSTVEETEDAGGDTSAEDQEYPDPGDLPKPKQGDGEFAELPRSFRRIFLGMGLEGLKIVLREDQIFYFREDRDVSLIPSSPDQTLVETQGMSFIHRAFFQLRTGEIFIMSFILDPHLVDHYSVFSTFVKRYGPPSSLSPKEAVWETEQTRISIERPLTVKYIDKPSFNAMVTGSSADNSRELLNRTEFLDGF